MSRLLDNRLGQGSAGRRGFRSVISAIVLLSILLGSQLLLAPTAVSQSTAAPGTVPLTQSVLLRLYDYKGYEVDSFSADTTVSFASTSSVAVSSALMTMDQYNAWQYNSSDPISNSLTYQNGTSIQKTVTVGPGQYFLVFYAYYGRTLVQFGLQVDPVTPYSFGAVSPPLAMGISSFGISNQSGVVDSYQIQSSQLVGVVNISSVQVNTPNAYRYGVSPTGFTVQLNAMLVVNEVGSAQKVYWVQNVPDFETGFSAVAFGDEIWNNTDPSGFLSNQTITSTNFGNGGFVYNTGATRFSSGLDFYSYLMNNETYSLPFNFALVMKTVLLPGIGVMVQTGYRLLSNGSPLSLQTVWFDNVTIHDPAAQEAFFEVSGSQTPPTGLYYDAELVFAGEGNLESAYFTQLDASLGLFYLTSTGSLSSFPTYYGFSGDTGEAASNLVESYANGIVHLSPGANIAFPYLGNASLSLDPVTFAAAGPAGTPTTTSTGTHTTTASTGSLTSTSQGSGGAQSSSLNGVYPIVGVALVLVAIIAAAALYRRRPSNQPPPQGTGYPPGGGELPPTTD